MASETLDTKGAAELLHISVQYTQQLANRGELPAVQLGGAWLFLKSDLIEWLAERARNEQRFRQEQAKLADQIPKPVRSRGRPRKTATAV